MAGQLDKRNLLLVEEDAGVRRSFHRLLPDWRIVDCLSVDRALEESRGTAIFLVRWGEPLATFQASDLVRAVRRRGDVTPIVVYDIFGRDDEEVAMIFHAGADDFISSPELRPNELDARLRALQRRSSRSHGPITVGHITVDVDCRRVYVDGATVLLTPGEYRLLLFLIERRGASIPSRDIYEAVFETLNRAGTSNALPAAICRLRRKLGVASCQLVAVPGYGYRLDGARSSGVHYIGAIERLQQTKR